MTFSIGGPRSKTKKLSTGVWTYDPDTGGFHRESARALQPREEEEDAPCGRIRLESVDPLEDHPRTWDDVLTAWEADSFR